VGLTHCIKRPDVNVATANTDIEKRTFSSAVSNDIILSCRRARIILPLLATSYVYKSMEIQVITRLLVFDR
jgi:hypothetical protein